MLKCGWLLSDINDNEAMQALVKRASIMHFEQVRSVLNTCHEFMSLEVFKVEIIFICQCSYRFP